MGASEQYSSGSRVVASPTWPSRTSSSTGSLSQKHRNVPVSLHLEIVCSAQFNEKNRVSPQKYEPPVTDSSGKTRCAKGAAAVAEKDSIGASGAGGSLG